MDTRPQGGLGLRTQLQLLTGGHRMLAPIRVHGESKEAMDEEILHTTPSPPVPESCLKALMVERKAGSGEPEHRNQREPAFHLQGFVGHLLSAEANS